MKHHRRASGALAGFTLVELLIVIVVIAILAAITIVAYNGIAQKAHVAVLKSDLAGNYDVLAKYNIDNSTYPSSQSAAGLKASTGTTLTYNPGSGNTSYCLQATNASDNYYVTDTNNIPTAGSCPVSVAPPIVAYNFDAGTGTTITDNSGNGNTLTFGSPSSWSTTGHTNGAFNGGGSGGIGAYNTVGLTNPSPAITIMGWVKPTGTDTTDVRVLFGFFDSSQNTYFAIYQNRNDWGTNGVLQVNARVGGTLQEMDSPALAVGSWVHLAATYDGSNLILYENGVQVATKAISGTLSTSNAFDIGAGAQALIDDVRVYNFALSASQISSVMNIPV